MLTVRRTSFGSRGQPSFQDNIYVLGFIPAEVYEDFAVEYMILNFETVTTWRCA